MVQNRKDSLLGRTVVEFTQLGPMKRIEFFMGRGLVWLILLIVALFELSYLTVTHEAEVVKIFTQK